MERQTSRFLLNYWIWNAFLFRKFILPEKIIYIEISYFHRQIYFVMNLKLKNDIALVWLRRILSEFSDIVQFVRMSLRSKVQVTLFFIFCSMCSWSSLISFKPFVKPYLSCPSLKALSKIIQNCWWFFSRTNFKKC